MAKSLKVSKKEIAHALDSILESSPIPRSNIKTAGKRGSFFPPFRHTSQ